MRNLIFYSFLTMVTAIGPVNAQKPQFPNQYLSPMTSRWIFLRPVDLIQSGRSQVIFHPGEFAGAPAGKMINIYIRYGRSPEPGSGSSESIYPEFTAKMGYTEKMVWVSNDTFLTGLTMVHYNPSWKRKFKLDTLGTWIKLPVNAGDFRYDPARRFVVEFSSKPPQYYIEIGSHVTTSNTRILTGFTDSVTGKTLGVCPDFGFDLAPTAVEQITGLTALGLFPNPAPGGRVNLTFETSRPINKAEVHILDLTGREVWSREFSGVGNSFFRELDLNGLAPGQYLLNLSLDGKRVTRQLSVQ